jgi:hypothetical protein
VVRHSPTLPGRSGYHVQPTALHSVADNLDHNAGRIRTTAGGLRRSATAPAAFGNVGAGFAGRLNNQLDRTGEAVDGMADRFSTGGSNVRTIARNYTQVDQEAADRFRRITTDNVGNAPSTQRTRPSSATPTGTRTTQSASARPPVLPPLPPGLGGMDQARSELNSHVTTHDTFLGYDNDEFIHTIRPENVVTHDLVDGNGRVMGVGFTRECAPGGSFADWARTTGPVTSHLRIDPRFTTPDGQPAYAAAINGNGIAEAPTPWRDSYRNGGQGPIFAIAHGEPTHYEVDLQGGSRVAITPDSYADLLRGNPSFRQLRQANPNAPLVALSCSTAANPGGSADQFSHAMGGAFRPFTNPIYAPNVRANVGVLWPDTPHEAPVFSVPQGGGFVRTDPSRGAPQPPTQP